MVTISFDDVSKMTIPVGKYINIPQKVTPQLTFLFAPHIKTVDCIINLMKPWEAVFLYAYFDQVLVKSYPLGRDHL